MPGSMEEGKDFIKDFVLDPFVKPHIRRILDVGPGSGNYIDLLSPHLNAEWIGVEIFEPYVDRYFNGPTIRQKYNAIIVADIYDVDWDEIGTFDLVILGDVLEHMEESRGIEVIRKAAQHSSWVIISLPIIDYPQGESYGNIHESHVVQYKPERLHEILADYEILRFYEGEVIGVYIFREVDE